jgi:hypothetical protein
MPLLKKLFPLVLFCLPVLSFGQYESEKIQYASSNDADEFVDWTPSRLSWDVYKGSPAGGSDAAAITSTALGMEYHVRGNKLSFSITCRFSKNRSWGKHRTEYILQHEQGHFDITEIFARKLAKELLNYKFNRKSYQEDINAIYNRVMEDKEKFQDEYDGKTDYSRNKIKQAEWLKRIQKELEDLEEYANYGSVSRN